MISGGWAADGHGARGGSADSPQEHGWGGRGEGRRTSRVGSWLGRARDTARRPREPPGGGRPRTSAFPEGVPPSDLAPKGLWSARLPSEALTLSRHPGRAAFPRQMPAWPACRDRPDQCGAPQVEAGRAHPHARGRLQAAGEGTSGTCGQTGGVPQDAGHIQTKQESRQMGMQTLFPSSGALAGGAPPALDLGSGAQRGTTEEMSPVMNHGIPAESTNTVRSSGEPGICRSRAQ